MSAENDKKIYELIMELIGKILALFKIGGETKTYGSKWEEFIDKLKSYSGLPDHVKLVMMSQAILESARGKSEIALKANNFLGMKMRPELEGVADPYMYAANDHANEKQPYAGFHTVESGIEGYKLFIQRSPYKGWDQTSDALEYLTLLKKAGYAESPTYIQKVSGLFDEAATLLSIEDTSDGPELPDTDDPDVQGVFVLKVGHLLKAKGASMAGKIGPNEYDYYKNNVAPLAVAYAKAKHPKIKIHVVLRDGMGITETYQKRIKPLNPDGVIELHYNGGPSTARGTETLCSNDVNDRRFAGIVQKRMCQVFGRSGDSRGVKVISKSVNGGSACHALPGIPNCLIEPAFGSNLDDAKLLVSKAEQLAECLVESFVELMK